MGALLAAMGGHVNLARPSAPPRAATLTTVLVACCAIASIGCSKDDGTGSPENALDGTPSQLTPCDPLAPAPTTLGTILGVGQDGQGTDYVADQSGCSIGRVFVTEGGALERQHVRGSGMRGDGVQGDLDSTFSFEDPSDAGGSLALLIQARANVVTAMALGPGSSRAFIGDPGATTQPLTVLDKSAVSGLAVHNLPGEVFEAFDVGNGDALVLTAPAENCSDADFRLFYGPPSAVVEGVITRFNESLSGATFVTFTMGSTSYDLSVPIVYTADSGPLGTFGPGTLEVDDAGALSVAARPAMAIDGLSFLCR